jgi:IrrE N-terminal-like domain
MALLVPPFDPLGTTEIRDDGPALRLDRMEIEEAGPDPSAMAAAIHSQLGPLSIAIPVVAIARALDIVEMSSGFLRGFEGALLMPPERGYGGIVVNAASPIRRQRFTIGHELGHFLNPRHQPVQDEGFFCSKSDLGQPWSLARKMSPHARQEAEANRFSIELLAPPARFRPMLRGLPTLEHVVKAATALDISKEACARRYIELCGRRLAIVLSCDGAVRYTDRTPDFPYIKLRRDDLLPHLNFADMDEGLGPQDEADPRDWGINQNTGVVVAETLRQANGFAMTLLFIETDE